MKFSGTSEQHEHRARNNVRLTRSRLKQFRIALKEKNCISALHYLTAVARSQGALRAEQINMVRDTPGERYVRNLEIKFRKACLRKNK